MIVNHKCQIYEFEYPYAEKINPTLHETIKQNLSIEDQVSMVDKVKRSESGMIMNPLILAPEKTIREAINSPRAELKVFGSEDGGIEHCQVDHGALAVEYMTDWVAEVL